MWPWRARKEIRWEPEPITTAIENRGQILLIVGTLKAIVDELEHEIKKTEPK